MSDSLIAFFRNQAWGNVDRGVEKVYVPEYLFITG